MQQNLVLEQLFTQNANIIKHWIALFGTPNLFLSDIGGEFDNYVFKEIGEQLNINIKTTVVESPWSNGIVEKHKGILGI